MPGESNMADDLDALDALLDEPYKKVNSVTWFWSDQVINATKLKDR